METAQKNNLSLRNLAHHTHTHTHTSLVRRGGSDWVSLSLSLPLCLSLSSSSSSSLDHQHLTAQFPPICAARGPPQPLNLNPPALRVYKYCLNHAGKSWSSETLRVAAEHPPFVLSPIHPFLCFLKINLTHHPHFSLSLFLPPSLSLFFSSEPVVVVVVGVFFSARPVACIFRLPKWFARLKLLRTSTMLYLGPKKSRSCGAPLRPARLWAPPRPRTRGETRCLSASSSAGIRRRCGASFTRVSWRGYPTRRSGGSGSSPRPSFYTLSWQVSALHRVAFVRLQTHFFPPSLLITQKTSSQPLTWIIKDSSLYSAWMLVRFFLFFLFSPSPNIRTLLWFTGGTCFRSRSQSNVFYSPYLAPRCASQVETLLQRLRVLAGSHNRHVAHHATKGMAGAHGARAWPAGPATAAAAVMWWHAGAGNEWLNEFWGICPWGECAHVPGKKHSPELPPHTHIHQPRCAPPPFSLSPSLPPTPPPLHKQPMRQSCTDLVPAFVDVALINPSHAEKSTRRLESEPRTGYKSGVDQITLIQVS